MNASELLAALLSSDPTPEDTRDVAAWWSTHQNVAEASAPIDAAFLGGFGADRLAWAFASGYQAAGRALFQEPSLKLGALCATEPKGNHPRAIATTLADGRLNGEKSFVTLGRSAEVLYVVARTGESAGRPVLVMVRVDPAAQGLGWDDSPQTPFVPEIPHARVFFRDVRVEDAQVLPGDGYADYLKPFRTIEDTHVLASFAGHLLATARRFDVGSDPIEELATMTLAIRTLALEDAKSPAVHIALAGAFSQLRQLIADGHFWIRVDDKTRERFERDRPLLSVAEKARARRTEVARSKLAGP